MASKAAAHNRKIARWGETIAAGYLASQGLEILGRNVRTPYGEIDVIARDQDVILFVEVKTRTSATFGLPEEAVGGRKLQHMIRSAECYAAEHEIDHWQIDVIAVEGRPGTQPVITRFENTV